MSGESQASGESFVCNGPSEVRIFGVEGKVLPGGKWLLAGHEQQPSTDQVVGVVRGYFDRLTEKGQGGHIARLVVEPVYAVVFYLSGLLTEQQLRTSVQEPGVILVPAFMICGQQVMLVINAKMQQAGTSVLVADAHGTWLQ